MRSVKELGVAWKSGTAGSPRTAGSSETGGSPGMTGNSGRIGNSAMADKEGQLGMRGWLANRAAVRAMFRPAAVALAASLFLGQLGGCGNVGARFEAKDVHAEQVKSDNAFAARLSLRLLADAAEANKNAVFSPLSVTFALSLLLNGAEGGTRDELLALLGEEGVSEASLNAGNEVLLDQLQHADPKVEVRIADAVWTRKGITLRADYRKRLQDYYGATAASLDFAKPDAAKTINRWASKQTAGRIDGIVDGSQLAGAEMVLMNAVYFNGEWQQPFKASGTRMQPFHLADGSDVNVPTMVQVGTFAHKSTAKFKAVRLPYGSSGDWGMIATLPQPGVTLQSAEAAFLGDPSSWREGFGTEGDSTLLQLPKFTFEAGRMLKETLESLGIRRAFDAERADFSGMIQDGAGRLFVSSVVHKAYISVDENGTEAAAVTKTDMTGSAGPPPKPFEFIADRPFFFAIGDRATGALVFLGAVANPAVSAEE